MLTEAKAHRKLALILLYLKILVNEPSPSQGPMGISRPLTIKPLQRQPGRANLSAVARRNMPPLISLGRFFALPCGS